MTAQSENDHLPDAGSRLGDPEVEEVSRVDSELDDHPRVELDDVFPNVGDLTVPYLSSYGSSGKKRLLPLFQYYFEVFGPSHLWGPTLATLTARMQFKRYVFEITMQQPAVLETVFALCQARLDHEVAPEASRSWAVLQHRGNVLRLVQDELVKSPENVSDATLWAIAGTIEGDITFSDWSSFQTNIIGARRIIAMKGGSENLGAHGWFQMFFAWAELRWTMHVAHVATMQEVLIYPTHPFRPDLCQKISSLPRGLSDIALSKSFSIATIELLHDVSEWKQRYVGLSARKQSARARYQEGINLATRFIKIFGSSGLKLTERCICIGVFAYVVSSDGSADQIERTSHGLEDHTVGMKQFCSNLDISDSQYLWVAVIISISSDSTLSPLPNRLLLLDRVIDSEHYATWTWEKVLSVLHKYFWEDALDMRGKASWKTGWVRKKLRRLAEGIPEQRDDPEGGG